MNNIRPRPGPGEIWTTKNGHKVKIIAGRSFDIIETAYVNGRVDGRLGMVFDADTWRATQGDDELVARA